MDIVLGQVVSGLMRGSFLLVVTVGLTLIYGVMSVLNLAHVSFYMLGAYFACTFWELLGGYGFSYWVSIPLTCLTIAIIGVFIEFVLMRHLYSRIQPEVLLATFALIYIFSDVAKLTWGLQIHCIDKPEVLTKTVLTIGAVSFPGSVAFTVGVAALVVFGLWFWLQRTKFGKIVRATQSNREMVSALGLRVPMIYRVVFTSSAFLAGLAGAIWVATGIVQPGRLDFTMLPQVFCVLAMGGMGSIAGTAVAAIIIGEVYALSILVAPKAAMVAIFAVTGTVLAIRPWGLLGTKERGVE